MRTQIKYIKIDRSWKINAGGLFLLTHHVQKRMCERHISQKVLEDTLRHGTYQYENGCKVYYVMRKNIKLAKKNGYDIKHCAGIHVRVTSKHADSSLPVVLTTFRNHNLKHNHK